MRERQDRIDQAILQVMQDNARIANAELSERVGISPSPCWRRVRTLEERGVIRKYVTLLDAEAVGLPVSVWINVTLREQVESRLEHFEAAVVRRPEVMECYLMTGEADYLLRVVVADLDAYQHFLLEHLTRIEGIASIKSSFALKQVKYDTALPLDHLAHV